MKQSHQDYGLYNYNPLEEDDDFIIYEDEYYEEQI
jgi:hypothetical protein